MKKIILYKNEIDFIFKCINYSFIYFDDHWGKDVTYRNWKAFRKRALDLRNKLLQDTN